MGNLSVKPFSFLSMLTLGLISVIFPKFVAENTDMVGYAHFEPTIETGALNFKDRRIKRLITMSKPNTR
jgi:hypothetical protein